MALVTLAATAAAIEQSGALDGIFSGGPSNFDERSAPCPGGLTLDQIRRAMANFPPTVASRVRSILAEDFHGNRAYTALNIQVMTSGGGDCRIDSDKGRRDAAIVRGFVEQYAPDTTGYGGASVQYSPASGDAEASGELSGGDHIRALLGDVAGALGGIGEALLTGGVREARYAAAGARAGTEGGRAASTIRGNTILLVIAAVVAFFVLRR